MNQYQRKIKAAIISFCIKDDNYIEVAKEIFISSRLYFEHIAKDTTYVRTRFLNTTLAFSI